MVEITLQALTIQPELAGLPWASLPSDILIGPRHALNVLDGFIGMFGRAGIHFSDWRAAMLAVSAVFFSGYRTHVHGGL